MLTWVTVPPLILGLFKGYENRKHITAADPYLLYKFTALSAIIGTARAYVECVKNKPYPTTGIPLISVAIAGTLIAGSTYYIGNKLGESVPRGF
jgi:hypothetical protein